uniref:Uncharacterized protein n=1 Tax=Meloidogyne enterolobii TaxID=390850 RepID=A0A6V7UMW3_MELEN|nr:unnamed protein product [Meloidogyne enterolobii]
MMISNTTFYSSFQNWTNPSFMLVFKLGQNWQNIRTWPCIRLPRRNTIPSVSRRRDP